jgi:hypothetical protein
MGWQRYNLSRGWHNNNSHSVNIENKKYVSEKTTKNYEIKGKGETILVGSDCIWCTTIDMDSRKSLNCWWGKSLTTKYHIILHD